MKKWPMILGLALAFALAGCNDDDAPGDSGVFIRLFGSTGTDLGHALVQTPDSGFVLAGSVHDDTDGSNVLLLSTDQHGRYRWQADYGGAGEDVAHDLLALSDGGFLILGSETDDAGDKDMLLLRTDASGGLLWSYTYGGSGLEEGMALTAASDGGYILAGWTESNEWGASIVHPKVYLVHVFDDGGIDWERQFAIGDDDRAYDVAIMPDGAIAVCGITYFDSLDYEAAVHVLDSDGDLQWSYNGISADDDRGRAILPLQDGNIAWLGYTYAGSSQGIDLVVQVIDASGAEVPGQRFQIGGASDEGLAGHHFSRMADGSYLLAGQTLSKGNGANDILLVRIGIDGSLTVDQTFGGNNDDIGCMVIPTYDNGYALVGYSKSFNFNAGYDIVLLKADEFGDLELKSDSE